MAHFCPACEQELAEKGAPHDCGPKTNPEVPSRDGGIGFFGCNMNPKSANTVLRDGPGYPNEDGGDVPTE